MNSKQIEAKAKEIALQVKGTALFTKIAIRHILELFNEHQTQYSNFKYLGNGSFGLVLEAQYDMSYTICLKIMPNQQDMVNENTALIEEYNYLKKIQGTIYVTHVYDCFYLEEEPGEKDYTVIVMEKCETNLVDMLQKQSKKESLSESSKVLMAIQMFDALNYLHQKQIFHRDIKARNFLIKQEENGEQILKICDFGFARASQISKKFVSNICGTKEFLAPEVFNKIFSFSSDLYSIGFLLLQLDNYLHLNLEEIEQFEFDQIRLGNVPFKNSKYTIDRSSALYKIASQCLNINMDERLTARDHLLTLIERYKQINRKQTPLKVYSIIRKEEIDILGDIIFNNEVEGFREEQQINELLSILQNLNSFDYYEFLGQGSFGLVLGVYNTKEQRYSALKIQKYYKNQLNIKEEIDNEIKIMMQIKYPCFVEIFSNFEIQKGGIHYNFIEMERCDCSLDKFLRDKLVEENELRVLKEEEKIKLAAEVMDSVNLLHKQNILHRDIKPQNFLIKRNQFGGIMIKLADFGFGRLMQNMNNQASIKRTPAYWAPEQFTNYTSTIKSDTYSVGFLILLIDNYRTFNFQFSGEIYQQLTQSYEHPFPLLNDRIISRNSFLYQIADSLMAFNPQERLHLKDNLINIQQSYQSISSLSLQNNESYDDYNDEDDYYNNDEEDQIYNFDDRNHLDQNVPLYLSRFSEEILHQSLNSRLNDLGVSEEMILNFEYFLSTELEEFVVKGTGTGTNIDPSKAFKLCKNIKYLQMNLLSSNSNGKNMIFQWLNLCINLQILQLRIHQDNFYSVDSLVSMLQNLKKIKYIKLDISSNLNNLMALGDSLSECKSLKLCAISLINLDDNFCFQDFLLSLQNIHIPKENFLIQYDEQKLGVLDFYQSQLTKISFFPSDINLSDQFYSRINKLNPTINILSIKEKL